MSQKVVFILFAMGVAISVVSGVLFYNLGYHQWEAEKEMRQYHLGTVTISVPQGRVASFDTGLETGMTCLIFIPEQYVWGGVDGAE